jgi:hypothetical protein
MEWRALPRNLGDAAGVIGVAVDNRDAVLVRIELGGPTVRPVPMPARANVNLSDVEGHPAFAAESCSDSWRSAHSSYCDKLLCPNCEVVSRIVCDELRG